MKIRLLALRDGKLLLRTLPGTTETTYTVPEGEVEMGYAMRKVVHDLSFTEFGVRCEPERMAYIVEHFFRVDSVRIHEICTYFLVVPEGEWGELEGFTPVSADMLEVACFQPQQLCELVAADLRDGFNISVRYILINDIPEQVSAAGCSYRL